MNEKLRGITVGLAGIVNLGCISALAYIGLKRNKDAYEAQMQCLDLGLRNIALDIQNRSLKREIDKLKEEQKVEEEA